jgi:hypothetical protein
MSDCALAAHTSAASDDASRSGNSKDEKQLINLHRLRLSIARRAGQGREWGRAHGGALS